MCSSHVARTGLFVMSGFTIALTHDAADIRRQIQLQMFVAVIEDELLLESRTSPIRINCTQVARDSKSKQNREII